MENDWSIERFESNIDYCDNCKHYEYDMNLDGSLYYFCSLSIESKNRDSCIFHKRFSLDEYELKF